MSINILFNYLSPESCFRDILASVMNLHNLQGLPPLCFVAQAHDFLMCEGASLNSHSGVHKEKVNVKKGTLLQPTTKKKLNKTFLDPPLFMLSTLTL